MNREPSSPMKSTTFLDSALNAGLILQYTLILPAIRKGRQNQLRVWDGKEKKMTLYILITIKAKGKPTFQILYHVV